MDELEKSSRTDAPTSTALSPFVSVVMPVYNCAPYLGTAIESILNQSFRDFELIVVNDGSTDRSLEIASDYSQRDSRITVVDTPNQGVVGATITGLARAQGTMIIRMDGDDICLPERFQKQVDYLSKNQDVVALGGQIMLIDPQGRELDIIPLPTNHDEIDTEHMTGEAAMTQPAVMFRASALKKVAGYRRHHTAEDIDLWLQFAEVGRLANLDDIILQYRQHEKSIGYTKRHEQMLSCWRAAKEAAERRGQAFELPRPNEEVQIEKDVIYLRWGWWAFQGKNFATARYYARKTLFKNPFNLGAWRLLYCSMFKNLKEVD